MTDRHGGNAVIEEPYGISDAVWRDIEGEGQLAAARERPALVRVVAVVAALTVGTTALLLSGIVTARLSGGNTASGGGGGKGDPYHLDFTLHNDGVTPVDLVRWDSRLDGVQVVGASPADLRLAPRGAHEVTITFRTTDCAAAVPAARAAMARSSLSGTGIGAVVDRPWGDMDTVVYPILSMENLVLNSCGEDTP